MAEVSEVDGNRFIALIGKTSDDADVLECLGDCGITADARKKRDRETGSAFLTNRKQGLEFTFQDERFLRESHKRVLKRTYEEGSLVLLNVRMYGKGYEDFRKFNGILPLELEFKMGFKEVIGKLESKPSWKGKDDITMARWDKKSYSLFVVFNRDYTKIGTVAVQVLVK